MSIVSFPQTVRGIQRLRAIAVVLSRHGFGHIVDRLNLRRYVPLSGWLWRRPADEFEPDPVISLGRRIVRVCEELGPTYIKLGQMASSRPDLFPAAIVSALTRLQDRVEPFEFSDVRKTVETDLGQPLDSLFSHFEQKPFASGSIAQVHRATTRDGRDVVVKVKRPGIDAVVQLDMHVLRWIADLSETHVPELRVYRPRIVVDEFAQTMGRELDFVFEGSATHRFAQAFIDNPRVHIPRVHWDLTATNVLTLQHMTGTPFRDVLSDEKGLIDRRALGRELAECFLKQFFELDLFHADPHPGNLLIFPPAEIGLIDFGMVGQVDNELSGQLVVALVAALRREVDIVIDVLADLAAIGPETDRTQLRRNLRELLEKYYGQPLKRLELGKIFYEITDLMRRHDVTLPRDFVMLGKSLVTVAGCALQLDPELNLLELIQPRISKMINDRIAPRRLAREFLTGSWHMLNILRDAPRQLRDWIRRINRGQVQINIRHQNLDHLASEIDRSSNRMAFSIFLAATIVGSSMLVQVPPAETVFGLPIRYFGLAGFFASFVMGAGLLIAILRSGKLS